MLNFGDMLAEKNKKKFNWICTVFLGETGYPIFKNTSFGKSTLKIYDVTQIDRARVYSTTCSTQTMTNLIKSI